jgi:hypothetical protein
MDNVQKLHNCVAITPEFLAVKTFRENASQSDLCPTAVVDVLPGTSAQLKNLPYTEDPQRSRALCDIPRSRTFVFIPKITLSFHRTDYLTVGLVLCRPS